MCYFFQVEVGRPGDPEDMKTNRPNEKHKVCAVFLRQIIQQHCIDLFCVVSVCQKAWDFVFVVLSLWLQTERPKEETGERPI